MIKNLCDMIEIYCGHGHKDPIPMYMKDGAGYGRDSFYACPKYYPENRDEDERACNNNLPITEYIKLVDKIDKILTNAAMNDQEINLTNMKFKIGQVEYTIFKHTNRKIKVSVVNKKAFNH